MRWIGCLLLVPFVFLAPLETFYISRYHHPTSAEIIATLVATNPRETREYLGNDLIPVTLSLLAALVLAIIATWWSARHRIRWRNRARTWILVVMIATPLAASAITIATAHGTLDQRENGVSTLWSTLDTSIIPGYPFGVIPRVIEYRKEWSAMRANASRLDAFRFHAQPTTHITQRQVYVLVIGESSRRANWQLFGYSRPTNPELSHTRNLVPITHMVTSWPETIDAVPQLLTRKPITNNHPFNEASILRAMQEAGYETWWISNQVAIGQFDSPVSVYAYEAQHVVWLNHASWTAPGSYDSDLLPALRDALESSNRNQFIVLHMMGSHLSYDFRYPKRFKHFHPTYSDGDSGIPQGIRLRNSYDNTILYTDHILADIIKTLRGTGAVSALWYESDHGEMLPTPTCSLGGHGIGTYYEYQIPALFWYSDSYARLFPERVTQLRENAGRRTLSASTFESLIDMAGIDFPGHNESWSLFSPAWRYHPRIVNTMWWKTDYDHADIGKKCPLVLPPKSKTEPAS